ncbi:nicotinate-nicotinamide nucleotide adenylyltransferase [Megalodesulfovibrio paquesii]
MAPRLGILGGSFNPPHAGHMLQARHAAALLGLTRLDMLPAAAPPHKPSQGLLPFEFRLELCKVALLHARAEGGLPDTCTLRVDDREGRRAGPSYTIETLREYTAELPGWEIIFLMGSIDLPTLPTWKDGQGINALAHLAVHPREEDDAAGLDVLLRSGVLGGYAPVASPLPGVPRCWHKVEPPGKLLWYLECTRLPTHATGIRELWNRGLDGKPALQAQLPAPVLAMLEERRGLVDAVWG